MPAIRILCMGDFLLYVDNITIGCDGSQIHRKIHLWRQPLMMLKKNPILIAQAERAIKDVTTKRQPDYSVKKRRLFLKKHLTKVSLSDTKYGIGRYKIWYRVYL